MIGGKKIQNFITFQTKDTIFLKQNQPQLIVHQQTIQTDSFKQLLSTKRSKHKPNFFQNPFRKQKQNIQSNQPQKRQAYKRSGCNSSNSRSKNTSKQRSLSNKYKYKVIDDKNRDHVKQFDLNLKDNTKRSKSNKNKLSKKVKSMIRLPKYSDKNVIELNQSKGRKSYSPNRNYSQGLKKTNPNNCSTQCIKTTKFTQSKDTTVKHLKSIKNQKVKKQSNQNKSKNKKSKQKIKPHGTSNINLNDVKSYQTQRRKQQVFSKIDVDKSKKVIKKSSPPKKPDVPKKKIQQKLLKQIKQKIPKKRKSMNKSKKNLHFESVDQMMLRHQNYQTTRNQTTGLSNYLSSRDSFKKKIKTDRDSLRPKKKVSSSSKQKQIVISSKNLNKLRNQAAIKIQKVYKGYITRKWLRQYLKILSAVVCIQKHWRGYQCRKRFKKYLEQNKNKTSNIKQIPKIKIDSIIQCQKSRQIKLDQSKLMIDKWKDILVEVMQQQTVAQAIKSKIKNLLQAQHYSGRSSMISQRSHRSTNSQQKLQEQIMSQRRYFQKKLNKKQQLSDSSKKKLKYNSPDSFSIIQQNDFNQLSSPSNRRSSLKSSKLGSPQHIPISPKLKRAQSPQQIISNLHEIQNYQKHNIILDAKSQKKQLQQMLQKNICSPKSFEIKEKQIDNKMQQSLKKFDQNIKYVIQSCKQFAPQNLQVKSFNDSLMMTPDHSQVKQAFGRQDFQNLSQNQVMSKLFQRVQNQGFEQILIEEQKQQRQIEFKDAKSIKIQLQPKQEVPTYQNFQTFNINALSQQKSQPPKSPIQQIKKIDPSYSFLDEYLLTMVEYLRTKDDGRVLNQIVKSVRTWKNLQPYVVLRNLSIVNDQNNKQQDGFGLPLYKYLQDDAQIIKQEYIKDYNKYFDMIRQSQNFQFKKQKKQQDEKQNQAVEFYLKLLRDCFNEALNIKRPSKYIFTQRSIQSYNNQKVKQQSQYDIQSQYDMICAAAMHQLFTWYNIKFGCQVSINQEQIGYEQMMMQNNNRLQLMIKMQSQKKWDQYYQKIQTIAKIGQEIFEDLLIKQTFTILNIERKLLKQRELFQ